MKTLTDQIMMSRYIKTGNFINRYFFNIFRNNAFNELFLRHGYKTDCLAREFAAYKLPLFK